LRARHIAADSFDKNEPAAESLPRGSQSSRSRRTGLTFTDPATSRSYVGRVVWSVKDVMMPYVSS
jgi:hypothetical protein